MIVKSASNRKEIRKLNQSRFLSNHRKYAVSLFEYFESLIPDQCFKDNTNIEVLLCLPMTQVFGVESFQFCNYLRLVDATPTSVGGRAFQGCTSLKHFNFSSVFYLGESAFENSGLESVYLKNTTIIPDNTFANCFNLRHIQLGNVQTILDGAFVNSMIQRLVIPSSCKAIHKRAFANNTFLTDLIFAGDTVPNIDKTAFENCAINRIWILCQSAIDSYKAILPKTLSNNIQEIQKPIDLLPLLVT